jgi:hypothetical protein
MWHRRRWTLRSNRATVPACTARPSGSALRARCVELAACGVVDVRPHSDLSSVPSASAAATRATVTTSATVTPGPTVLATHAVATSSSGAACLSAATPTARTPGTTSSLHADIGAEFVDFPLDDLTPGAVATWRP